MATKKSKTSDSGFDVSGNFIGEGWGGNPPPPPPPPDSAETDTDGNYTSALYQFEKEEVAARAAEVAAAAEKAVKEKAAKEKAAKEKADKEKAGEEEKKFYIAKVGKVNKRLYDYYQGLLKKMEHEEAIKRVKLKKIEEEWADENLVDLKSGEGIRRIITKDFGASKKYEHEFLGSAGAAAILNKLEKIKGKTDKETAQLKQNYVNQIIEANPEGASKMFGIDLQYGNITPESFEKTLVSSNQGNKNFDKNYYKTVGAYWDVNTPQTSGDQQSMANAFQQGNLKMTKANTLAIQRAVDAKSRMEDASNVGLDRIGGGQPATDPIDPDADPNKPYGNLTFDVYGRPITNYDYTGGPEQLYLGGGWKKDGIYAGYPWGPHTFKEGGIANFKPYGY